MDTKTKLFTSGWKFDKEQDILHSFKVYLLMREKNSNFKVEKPVRHHLNQVIKMIITNNGLKWHSVPPDAVHWEHSITDMIILQKINNLNLIIKKH